MNNGMEKMIIFQNNVNNKFQIKLDNDGDQFGVLEFFLASSLRKIQLRFSVHWYDVVP